MDAGAMNCKIQIQKSASETDRVGNHIQTWKTIFEGFAYVNSLSGREYWAAAAVRMERTLVFTLRYKHLFDGLNPKNSRLIMNEQIFDINFIDNVRFQNKTIKIKATERI